MSAAIEPLPTHTISLLVNNKPGVLIRIALAFSRRGFNIDSLNVSPSEDGDISHCTIVATGDADALGRIVKALNKLIDVIHAEEHPTEEVVARELSLIKVNATADALDTLTELAREDGFAIVDRTGETLMVQYIAERTEVDAMANRLDHQFGVVEMVRTGALVMTRGRAET